jgi:hypothetical protein
MIFKIKLVGIILLVLFTVALIAIADPAPYSPHQAASQSYAHNGGVTAIDINFTGTDYRDINGLSVNVLSGKTYLVKAGLHVTQVNHYAADPNIGIGGTAKGEAIQGYIWVVNSDDPNTNWFDLTAVVSIEEMGTLTIVYKQKAASGVDVVKAGSFMKIEPLN